MTIIFDLNRTLYDPDMDALLPGALEVLHMLMRRGYVLHLISKRELGREEAVRELGIEKFFVSVAFVDDKESEIKKIMQGSEGTVFVVGDYLHQEIRFGNRYGARTVWLKRGKFRDLKPETEEDVPWRTIAHLTEVESLLA